jgi:hypothetical protein
MPVVGNICILLYYVICSLCIEETMPQAGKSLVRDPMMSNNSFSIYLILPAALGPLVYTSSNRNEYQKHNKIFLENRARPAQKADTLIAVSRLSRHCGIYNISQSCRPPRPVNRDSFTLLYFTHSHMYWFVFLFFGSDKQIVAKGKHVISSSQNLFNYHFPNRIIH